ncbi:MAG TPA: LytTR family DNA-binding domain-containing protein [Chitinophagaceae bacterium]|nr:LytTR family DNA-binding domain-containing protein [Chitinophagaceae bacterium]
MIRAVIIDDEQNNIDNLRNLLCRHCPQVAVAATAVNADDGEKIIAEERPALVFLDIQMPVRNGFELLKSLPARNFELIFVTAYDQYGIQAIKFSAIDYLLKPVDVAELKAAVDKVSQHIGTKTQNLLLENLVAHLQADRNSKDHRIALPGARETRFVLASSIIRCEAANNYTRFYINTGEKIMVSKPIFEYEKLLSDYSFIRCHQSHLVNKKYIKSWVKEDGGYLLLDDGTHIPVSKQKREFTKNKLGKIA